MMNILRSSASPPFLAQHRWKTALISGLLLTAMAGAVILALHVNQYSASALIRIEHSAPFIAFSQGRLNAGDNGNSYIQTQLELLRSPIVLGPVLSRPEIASMEEFQDKVDPVGVLQQKVSIHQVGRSQLYQVHSVSKSPQDATAIANAVVAEYLSIQSDEGFRRSQRVIDLLEEERSRRSLEVERLRDRVMELAKEVTGRNPFSGGILDIDKALPTLTSLRERLIDVEIDWDILNEMIQSQKKDADPLPEHAMTPGFSGQDIDGRPEIRGWQAAIDQIDTFVEGMKDLEASGRENPDMANLVDLLQSQQTALGELQQELREQRLQQQNQKQVPNPQQPIAAMESKLAELDVKKEYLARQYNEQKETMKKGDAKSIQLEFAKAELAREEKVFEMIAARKLALQTELRAPTRVRLQKAAAVPLKPLDPVPYKVLLISCFAAFAVPFAFAFVSRPAKRESE